MTDAAFSVWVWVRIRIRVRLERMPDAAFRVWTQCTVPTGTRSGHPRGMALITRLLASSGTKA
jgi:hypothetical protein